jgi:hypothetical protein
VRETSADPTALMKVQLNEVTGCVKFWLYFLSRILYFNGTCNFTVLRFLKINCTRLLKRLFWNMLTGKLIPWIGVFLDKLIVTHMVKRAPRFMETKGLLKCSRKPDTESCPELLKSNLHANIIF